MSTVRWRLGAAAFALALARHAGAQEVELPLVGSPAVFTAGTGTPAVGIPKQIGSTVSVRVTCAPPFDCTKVSVGGEARDHVDEDDSPTPSAYVFRVQGGPGGVRFTGHVVHDGKPATNVVAFAPQEDTKAEGTLAQQVAGYLATPCRVPDRTRLPDADIVMTPFGRVLNSPTARYDDEAKVTVSVLADDRVKHLISVREASDLARPIVTNIYGSDAPPFNQQTARAATPAAAPPACSFTDPAPLGPFASPKGVAQVTVYDGTAVKDLGATQFVVAPLYTGTFTIGGISTGLAAPTYVKSFNGADTVIVERETGRRLLYTAMYTHFWRKRDLTRGVPLARLWEAITPTVGVVLNDAASNAVLGASVELRPGLALVLGTHIGRVDVLDGSTGARVGGTFENLGDVPLNRRWRSSGFYGLSVDVRAAGGLLRSLLGGTS